MNHHCKSSLKPTGVNMHPYIIEHDVTARYPAYWYAHEMTPDFAAAWVLPDGDGSFCVTGRDGQFYGGYKLEEARIMGVMTATVQPEQVEINTWPPAFLRTPVRHASRVAA